MVDRYWPSYVQTLSPVYSQGLQQGNRPGGLLRSWPRSVRGTDCGGVRDPWANVDVRGGGPVPGLAHLGQHGPHPVGEQPDDEYGREAGREACSQVRGAKSPGCRC